MSAFLESFDVRHRKACDYSWPTTRVTIEIEITGMELAHSAMLSNEIEDLIRSFIEDMKEGND